MKIKRLSVSHVAACRALRLRALKECPTAFSSSYEEERKRPASLFRDRLRTSPDAWTFGAFEAAALIGVVTLIRETRIKERHKANLFGMYVAPEARGKGVGKALIARCLEQARRLRGLRQVRLSVEAGNAAALGLYRSFGFVDYGRETDALKVSGTFYDELFLVRRLGRR